MGTRTNPIEMIGQDRDGKNIFLLTGSVNGRPFVVESMSKDEAALTSKKMITHRLHMLLAPARTLKMIAESKAVADYVRRLYAVPVNTYKLGSLESAAYNAKMKTLLAEGLQQ